MGKERLMLKQLAGIRVLESARQRACDLDRKPDRRKWRQKMCKLFSVDDHIVEPPGLWVDQVSAAHRNAEELLGFPMTVPAGMASS